MIDFEIPVLPQNGEFIESFMESVSRDLKGWNQKYWRQESNPNTSRKWKPRVKPTENWPILRKSGDMQDTAKFLAKGEELWANINYYGKYHMTGTERMVARPWLGVPDENLDEIIQLLIQEIINATKSI